MGQREVLPVRTIYLAKYMKVLSVGSALLHERYTMLCLEKKTRLPLTRNIDEIESSDAGE
jgi:hypothetical protein